ncbi:Uncharacterised protein [Mycobacteroides abscessus]|nr:Uncharacterised protein [Mycobacteroides abscessus]
MLSRVDLPVPERPTIETCSPAPTVRSMPRRISSSRSSGSSTERVTPLSSRRLISTRPRCRPSSSCRP